MGIAKGIAWALGIVPESDEKISKRIYKEQQKQNEKYKLRAENITNGIRLYGFKNTVEKYKNKPQHLWPMNEEQIKRIWSLQPDINDYETGKTYSDYFYYENNQNSNQLKQELLNKEKEILELKLELEKNKNR